MSVGHMELLVLEIPDELRGSEKDVGVRQEEYCRRGDNAESGIDEGVHLFRGIRAKEVRNEQRRNEPCPRIFRPGRETDRYSPQDVTPACRSVDDLRAEEERHECEEREGGIDIDEMRLPDGKGAEGDARRGNKSRGSAGNPPGEEPRNEDRTGIKEGGEESRRNDGGGEVVAEGLQIGIDAEDSPCTVMNGLHGVVEVE